MNKVQIALLAGVLAGLTVSIGWCSRKQTMKEFQGILYVDTVADIIALLPKTAAEIAIQTDALIAQTAQDIHSIITIAHEQRTFKNTIRALDIVTELSPLAVKSDIFQTLEMTSPDAAIRAAAHDALLKIQSFWVDTVSTNRQLYTACKQYADQKSSQENLTAPERYYLKQLIDGFEHAGLHLPDEQLNRVKELKKELAQLALAFEQNTAEDKTTIAVDVAGLAGLDNDFILQLKKTDDGLYSVGVDYPTFYNIIENCTVEDTRKRLSSAFANRAYPINEDILKRIIAVRDELARLVGSVSYAHLDLSEQMVKTPERARAFIEDLLVRCAPKEAQEIQQWTQQLPESVTLDADGKVKSWDLAFIKSAYKKKNFDIDERKIAEYFPMENTVAELLDIYRQFLSIEFEQTALSGVWHEDVTLITVYTKDKSEIIGYLLLDLYPRPNKYSHACHITMVRAHCTPEGKRMPAVSTVLANFPKPTPDKPALLMRNDVSTFFHEFGHALHALFGATTLGGFAGTSVKRDFVELPSQMLEEWLHNKQIIKKVSKHYKTGQPLADDMVDKIVSLSKFDTGTFLQTQCFYSLMALDLFAPGADKDPYVIMTQLQQRTRPHVSLNPHGHMYASFGHLTGYGAKYYGYMWSKVFALDLFNEIKRQGLLDPVIGEKYVSEVLSKGGSVDPDELLKNFLGREPNNQAFIADLGLETNV
jgi:thimet oligopeptidase